MIDIENRRKEQSYNLIRSIAKKLEVSTDTVIEELSAMMGLSLDEELNDEERVLAETHVLEGGIIHRVKAIKQYYNRTGAGLRKSKDTVDEYIKEIRLEQKQ